MNTTLVINMKGGVGKTTLAINLASYFAVNNVPTTIVDYDPQGSSLNWLSRRPAEAPRIHGANAAARIRSGLQSTKRYVPSDTQQLILDAPAGPSKLLMQDLLDRSDALLIPVGPSTIDIHATANFIKDLLLVGRIRHRKIHIAIVANRVRASESVYEPLERFVASLRLPFLTRIHDSKIYIDAAEAGIGIFEASAEASAEQQQKFMPIIQWVENVSASGISHPSNIVQLIPSVA